MNIADLLIIGVILFVLILAVKKMIKNKKAGKCNCGCCNGNCRECSKVNSEN